MAASRVMCSSRSRGHGVRGAADAGHGELRGLVRVDEQAHPEVDPGRTERLRGAGQRRLPRGGDLLEIGIRRLRRIVVDRVALGPQLHEALVDLEDGLGVIGLRVLVAHGGPGAVGLEHPLPHDAESVHHRPVRPHGRKGLEHLELGVDARPEEHPALGVPGRARQEEEVHRGVGLHEAGEAGPGVAAVPEGALPPLRGQDAVAPAQQQEMPLALGLRTARRRSPPRPWPWSAPAAWRPVAPRRGGSCPPPPRWPRGRRSSGRAPDRGAPSPDPSARARCRLLPGPGPPRGARGARQVRAGRWPRRRAAGMRRGRARGIPPRASIFGHLSYGERTTWARKREGTLQWAARNA